MQVAHSPGFEKRAQFYAARAYVDQMNEGEAYHDLKEIIFLAITNFMMFPEKPGYLSRHVILDNETFTRDLKDFSFTFMELPKFTMTVDQLETLIDKWAYFFKHTSHITPEEFEKFTANDLIFKQAYKALDRFYWTEIELNTYRQETKRILDERVIREHELAMSKAEGKAEGLAESKKNMLEVAQQMLSWDIPVEKIKALTHLSDSEMAQLMELTLEPKCDDFMGSIAQQTDISE
jgi:predicted transposase/invertase (TIGR01784 family)